MNFARSAAPWKTLLVIMFAIVISVSKNGFVEAHDAENEAATTVSFSFGEVGVNFAITPSKRPPTTRPTTTASKRLLTPSKRTAAPSQRLVTGSKRFATPSKRPVTPSKRLGTPTKRLVTASKRLGTPTKRLVTASKRLGTPTKRPVTPSKRPGTQTKRPTTPSRLPATPSKPGCSASSGPLRVGGNRVSTCNATRVTNQLICNEATEQVATYYFDAPSNAQYVFTSFEQVGTTTPLSVRESNTCLELGCMAQYYQRYVQVSLIKGQRVHVSIGMFSGQCSDSLLISITEYSGCIPSSYLVAPLLHLNTPHFIDDPCGPPYNPAESFCPDVFKANVRTFVAPSSGLYSFESLAESATYLAVVQAEECVYVSHCALFKAVEVVNMTRGQRVNVLLSPTRSALQHCDSQTRQGLLVKRSGVCRTDRDCLGIDSGNSTSSLRCYPDDPFRGRCLPVECTWNTDCPSTRFCTSTHRCNDDSPEHGQCHFCYIAGSCYDQVGCCQEGILMEQIICDCANDGCSYGYECADNGECVSIDPCSLCASYEYCCNGFFCTSERDVC
mmetsp:Transcript_45746/g.74630  ORF Transcript_45746/g.74630 Transcript_45746/m.74630 type:complete len:557 (+) Transcript_45746:215-1885(+)